MIQPRHMKDALHHVAKRAGPIAQLVHEQLAVSEASGQQYLPAGAIEKALTAAGYRVEYLDKVRGAWCRIFLDETMDNGGKAVTVPRMVAQGFAAPNYTPDGAVIKGTRRPKALLQAVRGAAREEALYAEVDKALKARGVRVDRHLRDHLVVRLSRNGPGQLTADVETMAQLETKAKAAAKG